MKLILNFAKENQTNTCTDLKIALFKDTFQKEFLSLNGIGPKTLDYTMKLLNFDTVAVDRHIYSFVALANVKTNDYFETKKVVEYAADFLEISRSAIDRSIWVYMSQKMNNMPTGCRQLSFEFS